MSRKSTVQRIKPPALHIGDTVGIVAPASDIKKEALDAGCEKLHNMGYEPFYLPSILDHDLYFAGSVKRRATELEEMFVRDKVRAIVCARGGYGANYLLECLDFEKIKAHPKIFVGYSDITTLLTRLGDLNNLVVFHGPMVTKDFAHGDGVDTASWEAALSGHFDETFEIGAKSGAIPLINGSVEGFLYGGCLSMLAASLGTPYEIKTQGTILFIEDIATKPFQIDRMLMQLKLAGKFSGVKGIIFGEMLDCIQHKDQTYTLEEVVLRIVGGLGIPVAYGLRSGHVSRRNITLPLGVRAALKVQPSAVTLSILESPTATAD